MRRAGARSVRSSFPRRGGSEPERTSSSQQQSGEVEVTEASGLAGTDGLDEVEEDVGEVMADSTEGAELTDSTAVNEELEYSTGGADEIADSILADDDRDVGAVVADTPGGEVMTDSTEELGTALTSLTPGIVTEGEDEAIAACADPQDGAAVSVTQVVTQALAIGAAVVLGGACSNELGMSSVATALQEQEVPFSFAEEAMTLHVAGIIAPEDTGTQHAEYPSESGLTSVPHYIGISCTSMLPGERSDQREALTPT